VNLHQLRIFCAVVEEGSFRQAAEKLFLSQPSVSQHVASLEKDHSIRLFERKGRTISLTPEGRALYVLASDLLRQADEIPARFRDMQALRSGRLETGVSPFAGYYILPPALADFRAAFPSVSVSVSSGNTTEILSDLRSGEVELVILGRNFPSSREPDLTYRILGEDPLVLVAAPFHPWALRGQASFAETAAETLIRFAGDCPLGTYVDEFLLRNRIRFGGQVETDEIEMAKHLALRGVGVAITSSISVQKELASGELAPVILDGMEELSWEIQCVYSSTRGLSYAGWEMVKRLEEQCRSLLK
jgi:DNA-binding transcriptional LysR family regulator